MLARSVRPVIITLSVFMIRQLQARCSFSHLCVPACSVQCTLCLMKL
jgi:hypothetical protein